MHLLGRPFSRRAVRNQQLVFLRPAVLLSCQSRIKPYMTNFWKYSNPFSSITDTAAVGANAAAQASGAATGGIGGLLNAELPNDFNLYEAGRENGRCGASRLIPHGAFSGSAAL
jgi:hypothetical protein